MSRIYPANVFIDELGFVACGFDPSWLRDQGWRQWTPLPKISVPIYKPEMPGINSHPGLVDPWGVSMMSARSAVLRRRSCLESNPFQLSALREVESRCLDLTGLPGPEAAVPRLDPASSTCAKCSTASFQIRTFSSRSERTSAVGEGRNLLNDSVQVRQQRNGQPIASRHPMITTDDDPEFARVTDTQLRRSNGTHLCR